MAGFELYVFQAMVSPWFKNMAIPIATLLLTVFFKVISKETVSIEKNDFFVCFDLCTSAIFVFAIGMIDLANQIVNPPNSKILELIESNNLAEKIVSKDLEVLKSLLEEQSYIIMTKFGLSSIVLVLMFFMIFIISVITRCWGWDSNGVAKWGLGIILPNALGLSLLILATIWITI